MRRPRMAHSLEEYLTPSVAKRLPEMQMPGSVAEKALRFHQEHGGSTFSLFFGNLAGRNLYAVSVYPERGSRIPSRLLTNTALTMFIEGNMDLLSDPRCCVGTWEEDGYVYLDVSAALENSEQAIRLGMQYNQIAIYSLREGAVINTGGSGEALSELPPETERLPPLP